MTLAASPRCIELIKTFEGFSAVPYLCPAKVWTIGYGTTNGITSQTPPVSEQEATELLRRDLVKFERSVRKLITFEINQNQFDALVSFIYNLGGGALQRSTLRSKLNRGDIYSASDEFLKWTRAGGRILKGLVKRRLAERELFLS